MSRDPKQEVVHFLSDLYSVELQAIAQLTTAPDIAGDERIALDYRTHYLETEQHAKMVHDRLEALGGSPSAVKDAIMKLGGKGFILFAEIQTETPGRLMAHSFSYEAMEWAGYEALIRLAELAGDMETATLGRTIQAQEREMMDRLESGFDAAEDACHRDTAPDHLAEHVRKHLAEAHAIEAQSLKMLEKSAAAIGDPGLAAIYSEHADETRAQIHMLEQRLKELGEGSPTLQDAALKLGAMEWAMFFRAQSDTPVKLHAFAYALEHLEIGGYELLLRTARRAGDSLTEALCQRILVEERRMAERIAGSMDDAVRRTAAVLGN
jgi:ferritin-like metal-binding protein YciE